jgi:hypothetical protein
MVEYIYYDEDRFRLLNKFRDIAANLMKPLVEAGYKPYIYGSVARGDVSESSDIDIILLHNVNPILIEDLYIKSKYKIFKKVIVQATPSHTPKLYLWLDESGNRQVSLPLGVLKRNEFEFFRFGGLLEYEGVYVGKRIMGVDKRLMLIIPTDEGHRGECILGREGYVARLLNVSESLVRERVAVLTRREEHGRTGVFLEYEYEGDTLETISYLCRVNKFFRRSVGML